MALLFLEHHRRKTGKQNNIKVFWSKNPKGPKQDRKNILGWPMM